MNNKELKELCRMIIERGRAVTSERDTIANECRARGIRLNMRCPNCYVDAATIIYRQLQNDEKPEQSAKRYVLRPGVNVYFGSVHVCEEIMTDELAEKLLKQGFSIRFFAKYPGV